MKEIKKIGKKSLAKITALVYGLAGFFVALLAAAYTIAGILTRSNFQGSAMLVVLYNIGVGLLLGVLASMLTALCGWVMGYITAGIYNWFAKNVGGVKVELADEIEEKKTNNN